MTLDRGMEQIGARRGGSGRYREQRRRGLVVKVSLDGLEDKRKRRASLQRAGRDHGPEAFVGAAAVGTASALGDMAVDDHEADRLFGDVTGESRLRS